MKDIQEKIQADFEDFMVAKGVDIKTISEDELESEQFAYVNWMKDAFREEGLKQEGGLDLNEGLRRN